MLDGVLAFFGSVAFLGLFVVTPISAIGEWCIYDEAKAKERPYPATIRVALWSTGLLLVVIVLGLVNMFLPR